MQEELMLTRRQKTLSNISNFMPLHIVLNEPAGVKFSITVPKFFTVEQLARQIEAEYAYLVEREIGHSRFPLIECGALFDHLEPDSKNRRRSRQRARNNKSTTYLSQSQSHSQSQSQSQSQLQDQGPSIAPSDKNPADIDDGNDSVDSNDNDTTDSNIEDEHNSGDSDSGQDTFPDERDEQESRGVQLRFSDIVADVLDRDSTVHVVNIDQGMYTMSEPPSHG
ncbi:hypothetical protein BG003_010487 [Podila horticola]|nr:hypothetical protein BG003_010487 [Podila horticola]